MRTAHKKQHKPQGSTRIIGAAHHGRATDNSADFHAAFSAQFLQRYADLFQALAAPVQHVALLNSFTTVNDCEGLGLTQHVWGAGPITCYRFPEPPSSYPPPPSCPYTQLKQFYWLDLASVLPSLLLGVAPHHVVLDMCAAPGGKSLVLAMQLLLGSSQEHSQEGGQGAEGQAAAAAATGQQGMLTPELLQQLQLSEPQAAATADAEVPVEQQDPVNQQQQQSLANQQQEDAQQHSEQQQQQAEQLPAADTAAAGILNSVHPPDSSAAADGDHKQGGQGEEEAEEEEEEEEEAWPPPASSSSSSAVGRLVCNELDPARRSRLTGVLSSYLPGSLRWRVRVTGQDAAKHWARFESGMYDRVLLDAPCSSERHVVQAALEAGGVVSSSSWSREHCQALAALQLRLLLAGLKALKPGGRLMYSTCSMAVAENDDVVQQAVAHSKGAVSVVPAQQWGSKQLVQAAGGELTQHGMLCLPDRAGWGPIYLSLLQKEGGDE